MKRELARGQAEWEKSDALSAPMDWTISRGMVVQRRLAGGGTFDGQRAVEVDVDDNVAKFGFYDKFTLSAWIRPTSPTGGSTTTPICSAAAGAAAGAAGWPAPGFGACARATAGSSAKTSAKTSASARGASLTSLSPRTSDL